MTEQIGAQSYFKFGVESDWSTGVTPDLSVPLKSGSCKPTQMMKTRNSELRNSRYPQKPLAGAQWTPQNILMNTYPNVGLGYWLWLHCGSVSSTQVSSGVYDNVFEPGLTVPNSFTTEFGLGLVNPILVAGFKSNQLDFVQGLGDEAQMLTLACSGGGKFGTEGSTNTFTDPTLQPMQADEVALTNDGDSFYADSLQWSDVNGLIMPNHKIGGGAEMREPGINGPHSVTGSFQMDFEDLTSFDDYRALNDIALVAIYTSGQTITGEYTYDFRVDFPGVKIMTNPLPEPSSPDLLKAVIEFECYAKQVAATGTVIPVRYTLRSDVDYAAV